MSETNTLVIYKSPKTEFETVTHLLEDKKLAGLVRFIQLRFLRRILAVFDSVDAASKASPVVKASLGTLSKCQNAKVGFSMTTNDSLAESHLSLPDKGTLLFVSPPPSPPNEWVSQSEEEPNQRTHYEAEFSAQLTKALKAYEETSSPGFSPVEDRLHKARTWDPESPRTVTIIEARETNPALNVTSSED